MIVCKYMDMGYAGYQWPLGAANDVIMEYFSTWEKQYGYNSDVDMMKG